MTSLHKRHKPPFHTFHVALAILYHIMTIDIDFTTALRSLTKRENEEAVLAHTFSHAVCQARLWLAKLTASIYNWWEFRG